MTPFILLASRSSSRAKLLTQAGLAFEQVSPPFQDPAQPVVERVEAVEEAGEMAVGLARRKARSVVEAGGRKGEAVGGDQGVVVVSADTVVVAVDGGLLGQPENPERAREILGRLVGAEHRIVTGVCLAGLDGACEQYFYDVARVRIGAIGDAELTGYVASGRWRGKAGGYNYEELRGQWRFEIEGDPGTVVGLPMARLREILNRWNDDGGGVGR